MLNKKEKKLTLKKLTAKEKKYYIEKAYEHCPYCHSEDLSGGNLEADGKVASEEVRCAMCGRTWTCIYTITGIEEECRRDV